MTVPALELELAYRTCEDITRREAANFHYGIRLLPRDKRQAMSAVYAFARVADRYGRRKLFAVGVTAMTGVVITDRTVG